MYILHIGKYYIKIKSSNFYFNILKAQRKKMMDFRWVIQHIIISLYYLQQYIDNNSLLQNSISREGGFVIF